MNVSNSTQVGKNNENTDKPVNTNEIPSPAKELEVEQDDLEDDDEEEEEDDDDEEEVCVFSSTERFIDVF